MIKNYLLFFFLSFNTFIATAQKDSIEAHIGATKYFNFIKNNEYDSVVNNTYYKLFDVIPKQLFKTQLVSATQNGLFSFSDFDIINILRLKINNDDDTKFHKINYSYKMTLIIDNNETSLDGLVDFFSDQYGRDNISKGNKTIVITVKNQLLGIKEKNQEKWQFINIDNNRNSLYNIIPADVMEQ